MRNSKVDVNHPDIVKALRDLGATVFSIASVGRDKPDIVVGINGINVLAEIKADKKKKLTDGQEKFRREWKGRVDRLDSVQDAIALVSDIIVCNGAKKTIVK
jgi:hypothetical protein